LRAHEACAQTDADAHDLASRPKDFLTKGEVKALLAAAKDGRHGARDYLLLTMIFQHALRAIEACRLRVDQIDLEAAGVDRARQGRTIDAPAANRHAVCDYIVEQEAQALTATARLLN
jgi:integrase